MTFSYIDNREAAQYGFIPFPKALLTEEIFSPLSSQSKLMYSLLLDRMSDSLKNKWQDEYGRIYVIYPVSEIQEDMHISKRKTVECLSELESLGLIERKKRGRGLPSLLYVKNFMPEVC